MDNIIIKDKNNQKFFDINSDNIMSMLEVDQYIFIIECDPSENINIQDYFSYIGTESNSIYLNDILLNSGLLFQIYKGITKLNIIKYIIIIKV